jgi:hypothetical protein
MYLIGSDDNSFFSNDTRFGLSKTQVTVNISDTAPLHDVTCQKVNINEYDCVLMDPRFSRLPNFKYLPPLRTEIQQSSQEINSSNEFESDRHVGVTLDPKWKKSSTLVFGRKGRFRNNIPQENLLGNYQALSSYESLSDQSISDGLKYYENENLRVDIDFTPCPTSNRIICQVFEQKNGTLLKLDVIDFGKVKMENGQICPIYFVGKVITDENLMNTFIHIFTLVFESYLPSLKQSHAWSKVI